MTGRVALTGGIATGKSACLRAFEALGASIVDADVLARQAVEPGTPGLAAVVARFGPHLLRPDGSLDRPALGRVVFADAAARRDLEAIIHPFVYAAIESHPTVSGLTIVDIPLLFETGREKDFASVIVAACTPEQQLARLMKRDHLSEAEAKARISAQLPIGDKVRRADYVIDTSGTHAETDAQVARLWQDLTGAVQRP